MFENSSKTKEAVKLKLLFKKPVVKKRPFYRKRIADDFLCRLTAMKEQGGLMIGGRRIC